MKSCVKYGAILGGLLGVAAVFVLGYLFVTGMGVSGSAWEWSLLVVEAACLGVVVGAALGAVVGVVRDMLTPRDD